MQFSKNTSTRRSTNIVAIIIKGTLVFLLFFVAVILLNKIDFPSPNKEIEKIIPNEKIKIVK
jgi:hypothetical protein|tara:strand:- start:3148 stop:3333 length:186 start_codon:yes stop_codon:yes gene_type:complete